MTEIRSRSNLERHVQTILVVTIAGLMAWGANSLNNNNIALARVDERMTYMAERITGLELKIREATADRYTGSEAKQELGRIREQLREHEQRIRKLETPVFP